MKTTDASTMVAPHDRSPRSAAALPAAEEGAFEQVLNSNHREFEPTAAELSASKGPVAEAPSLEEPEEEVAGAEIQAAILAEPHLPPVVTQESVELPVLEESAADGKQGHADLAEPPTAAPATNDRTGAAPFQVGPRGAAAGSAMEVAGANSNHRGAGETPAAGNAVALAAKSESSDEVSERPSEVPPSSAGADSLAGQETNAESLVEHRASEVPGALPQVAERTAAAEGRDNVVSSSDRPPIAEVAADGRAASEDHSRAAVDETGRTGAPPELDTVRLLHRVARAFHVAQRRGGELTLRLSPPELGSVRLEVRLEAGTLTARLEAETEAARAALVEHLPVLRERLAEQGIRIERFDVDLMQQQGREPGTKDQEPAWQRGRTEERESGRVPRPRVEIPPSLSPSPSPSPTTPAGLNVII